MKRSIWTRGGQSHCDLNNKHFWPGLLYCTTNKELHKYVTGQSEVTLDFNKVKGQPSLKHNDLLVQKPGYKLRTMDLSA